jgi:hypothetical protein
MILSSPTFAQIVKMYLIVIQVFIECLAHIQCLLFPNIVNT